MHESDQRGKLMLNGKPVPEDALARILGLDKQILTTSLNQILTLGVGSVCEDTGALVCRRMVRDENIRKVRQNCGKLGGNPALLNQNSTTGVKQKPTPSSSSSASAELNKIEPPSGFPKSEEEAIERGAAAGAARETCIVAYNLAVSRNYTDDKGRPVGSWAHYVKAGHTMNASRKEERASLHRSNGDVPRASKPRTSKDALLLPLQCNGPARWTLERPPARDHFKREGDYEVCLDEYEQWKKQRMTDFFNK